MSKPQPIQCFVCDGVGRYTRFEDCDPIEGYKLAPRYKCRFCDGAGHITASDERFTAARAYIIERDRAALERARKESRAVAEKQSIRKQAMAKLTPTEIEVLGLKGK